MPFPLPPLTFRPQSPICRQLERGAGARWRSLLPPWPHLGLVLSVGLEDPSKGIWRFSATSSYPAWSLSVPEHHGETWHQLPSLCVPPLRPEPSPVSPQKAAPSMPVPRGMDWP